MAARAHALQGHLIDLTPDEAGVLSFVAANANVPSIKPQLETILATSSARAQAIGAVILGGRDTSSPKYRFMAKRFTDASANNSKNVRILNNLQGF